MIETLRIREIEMDEAIDYMVKSVTSPPRFLIVNGEHPDHALFYGGNLGRPTGADWIHVAILEARRVERRRNARLILTHEQEIVERVGKILDINRAWPLDRDPIEARAKLDHVARAVIPEAYMPYERSARTKRLRREREEALRTGAAPAITQEDA